jgi:hypothetical protein
MLTWIRKPWPDVMLRLLETFSDRDAAGVRLLTRNGIGRSRRYPGIASAVNCQRYICPKPSSGVSTTVGENHPNKLVSSLTARPVVGGRGMMPLAADTLGW